MEPLFSILGKKRHGAPPDANPPPNQNPSAQTESEEEVKLRLYKLIIDRYHDKIEECETKTVSDLKLLIQPRHPLIVKIREAICEDFHPYLYEENFLGAAKMAFSRVAAFRTVSVPVPFWLTLDEVQELMAGDEIDKSIFLCSLLRALGSENARVFLTDTQNSYVVFQHLGRNYVADHSQAGFAEPPQGKKPVELLKGKVIYAFNDKEYDDYQEGEGAF